MAGYKACDVMKAEVVAISVHGKTLNAESSYPGAAVRLENTGPNTWERKDRIEVWLGIGAKWDRVEKGFLWRAKVEREVDPGEKIDIRFNAFETPSGVQRWPLFVHVTCGGGHSKTRGKSVGKFSFQTKAQYKVSLVRPSKTSYSVLEKYDNLKFGFKNTGQFTLPAKGKWNLMTEIHPPSGATAADRRLFEHLLELDDWGDDDVEPGELATAEIDIDQMPAVPGVWVMELTLLRGSQLFEPCAGTPANYKFQIERFDPADHIEAKIDSVSMWGSEAFAETDDESIDIKLRNLGELTWEPRFDLEVVAGVGDSYSRLEAGHVASQKLTSEVAPQQTQSVSVKGMLTPMWNAEWPLTVALLCNGRVVVEQTQKFRTRASYSASIGMTGDLVLEYGQRERWQIEVGNSGDNTWPSDQQWELIGEAKGPSGTPTEAVNAFSFASQLLGDPEVGHGDSLQTDHFVRSCPEVPGKWELQLTLLRGGRAFDAVGNPRTVKFEIAKALPKAELVVGRLPSVCRFGQGYPLSVAVDNVGKDTFEARSWRLEVLVKLENNGDPAYEEVIYDELGTFEIQRQSKKGVSGVSFEVDGRFASVDEYWGDYSVRVLLYLEGHSRPLAQQTRVVKLLPAGVDP